ncbi:MAG TPA: hypothetical protein VFV66_00310 [Nonomuraea sp.]|nr:hypothetical protein [Nonomuraea sp.]
MDAPDLPPALLAVPRRTRDLQAAGVTRYRIAGHLWTPVFRGVHAWCELDPAATMPRIMAAAALLPPGAALGGWAALHLLGVRDLDGRAGPGGRRLLAVPICLGPVGRMRPRPGILLDRSRLRDEDVTLARGVPVTTAVRSCVDIMCRDGVEEGVVAGDAAARFRVALPSDIRAYVDSLGGRRGVPAARTAAALLDGRAASCTESRLRVVWVLEAGLPVPRVNVEVVDDAGFLLGEADLFDPWAAMVAEYDGKDHRDLARATSDNIREELFERANVVVVRATALDLWPRRAQLVRRLQTGHRDGLARDRRRDRWRVRC